MKREQINDECVDAIRVNYRMWDYLSFVCSAKADAELRDSEPQCEEVSRFEARLEILNKAINRTSSNPT